jgi:hypothetical protein
MMQLSMPRHGMRATSPSWVNAIRKYVLVVTLGAEMVRRPWGDPPDRGCFRSFVGIGWTQTDRLFIVAALAFLEWICADRLGSRRPS